MEFKVSLQAYSPKSSVGSVAPIFLLQPMRLVIDDATVRVVAAAQPTLTLLTWKKEKTRCEQLDMGLVKFAVSNPTLEEHTFEFACLNAPSVQQAFNSKPAPEAPVEQAAASKVEEKAKSKEVEEDEEDDDEERVEFHEQGLTLVRAPPASLHTNLIYAILVMPKIIRIIGYSSAFDEHTFNKGRYTLKAPEPAETRKKGPDTSNGIHQNREGSGKESVFEIRHDEDSELAVATTGRSARKKGQTSAAANQAPLVGSGANGIWSESDSGGANQGEGNIATTATEQRELSQWSRRHYGKQGNGKMTFQPQRHAAVQKEFPRERTAFKVLDYYQVQPDGTHPDVVVFDVRGGGSYSFECRDRRPFLAFFKAEAAPKVLL